MGKYCIPSIPILKPTTVPPPSQIPNTVPYHCFMEMSGCRLELVSVIPAMLFLPRALDVLSPLKSIGLMCQ